jgi:glycosyltransferase involved in cell wall biosynthesis
MTRQRIIVTGYMARCPIAGVIWQHIHYIVGLQRLGHEVFYIEDSTAHPYHPLTYDYVPDWSYTAAIMPKLARQFGFEDRWGYRARYLDDRPTAGLSGARIDELYREADAVLNVCGEQELHEDLLQARCLIYIESDPGKEQCLIDSHPDAPIRQTLAQYHAVFTFGEHIGTPRFPVPLHGVPWQPTRQPIVTDFWKTDAAPPSGAVFTSVANWNTKGKDIAWRGDHYLWSKALEFLRFMEAPRRAGEPFELATNLRDETTRAQLIERGWRLTSPQEISIDHDLYVRYLRDSKGEFTVAKDQYVRLHTGWFSDRTACYLACGRPVITQDTGFTQLYGGDRGLLAFRTLEEAAEAVRIINTDYAAHCRAAYEIAVETFEATKVVASILDRSGL